MPWCGWVATSGVASSVFVGDDVTDEEAFAVLGADDVAIKVGGGDTIAAYRLRGPGTVAEWLTHLANALTDVNLVRWCLAPMQRCRVVGRRVRTGRSGRRVACA